MSRQEYHFRDGKSDKFWAIDVQGSSFTVQFGRTGTGGQTQTKKFASDAEAQKAADKLVAEKTKKGYVAVGSIATTTQTGGATAAPAKGKKKAKTAPAAEETSDAPSPSALVVTRSIDLAPRNWLVATWRPRQSLSRPAAPPFDLDKALKRFQKEIRVESGYWDWAPLHLTPPLSREEAHF
jgi:predicted DNA-binding WGR domain protein